MGRRRHTNSKRRLVAALAIFLAGAALIVAPYVGDYAHRQQQARIAEAQQQAVQATRDTDLADERTRAEDYNERLRLGRTVVTDPFDPEAERVVREEYQSLLNLAGDGVMATLYIPSIDLELPIYHGTEDDVLQEGVGHLEGTSLPVGGASTHAVLAGHNGLPTAKIFDRLGEVEVGDYLIIRVLGEDLAYRVTSTETVLPTQTESLAIQDGRDLVTLVTCVPYGLNTHRLLVHAERSELPASWSDGGEEAATEAATALRLPVAELAVMAAAVGLGLLATRALAQRQARRRVRRGAHFAPEGRHRSRR